MLPNHVAIIMDGNRRWAKERGLKAVDGHRQGVEALEKIVKHASKLGLKYLTVYALSSENLEKRGKNELLSLFSLITAGFVEKLPLLQKEKVRIVFLGERKGLPAPVLKIMAETERKLDGNSGPQLNIALNYGSRDEIVQAAKNFTGSEEEFSARLFTAGIPDPDLIIRTGGQRRLSNFLLWQAAYSELYFTDTLWPDFSEKDFTEAVEDFANRKRNFGV